MTTSEVSSHPLLVDRAAAALRTELLSGTLPSGSRVNVAEMAQRLGMSTIPVREALRMLATEGLVVALPLRGFRVPEATSADLEDTYRLRVVLDPMAVELAIPRLTAELVERLEQELEQLQIALHAQNPVLIRDANRAFHFSIYQAADAPWLVKMISMLWENTERYHHLGGVDSLGTPSQRTAEHAAIFAACSDRDAVRAASAMREHLMRTWTVAREVLWSVRGAANASG